MSAPGGPFQFDEEEAAEIRRLLVRQGARFGLVFAALCGFVFLVLWWSGAAVRFSAARAGNRAAATWHVRGTVRDAATGSPVPWAVVEDDQRGEPPFFRTEADQAGRYDLATLPEPHRVRVGAPGFLPMEVIVGRTWFLWLPKGTERKDFTLTREAEREGPSPHPHQ